MKKTDLIFASILLPLDFLALVFAAVTAYYLRFAGWVRDVRPVSFDLAFSTYMDVVVPVALLWLIIFAGFGLYMVKGPKKLLREFSRVFAACSTGLTLIVFLVFFSRELFSSRFIVLVAWVLAILFVTFGRLMIRLIKSQLYKRGIGSENLIIVGADKTTNILVDHLNNNPKEGYQIVGVFKKFDRTNEKQLLKLIESKNVDQILQSDYTLDKKQSEKLLSIAEKYHLGFKYAADLFETRDVKMETLLGIPLVQIKKTPLEGWGRIIKRVYDILVSILSLILFSPLILIIAILIKIDSRGPVIYRNKRVGYQGEMFDTYKFRTMKIEYCTGEDYDQAGEASAYERELIQNHNMRKGGIYKIKDDPRRTRIGKFLERISLDELPQFLNVLKGNMSIVGPRPHQEREVMNYIDQFPRLFDIKPGITGLAQISGRSDLDTEDEIKLDLYYIENWSFLSDIAISIKTPFVVLIKKHQN